MNSNQIWRGHDYAYTNYPRRDPQAYYSDAVRMRVIAVYPVTVLDYYDNESQKRRNMVDVQVLHPDGSSRLDSNGKEMMRTVRARQLVKHWEDHEVEHNRYVAQREARYAEQRKREEEYQEQRREREEKLEKEIKRIKDAFVAVGFKEYNIRVDNYQITIGRRDVDEWVEKSLSGRDDQVTLSEGSTTTTF